MNQNSTLEPVFFELDSQYSTTRCITHTQPIIVNKPEDKISSVLFLPDNPERKAEGGLRTQGYFKQSLKDKPLISVITVVFNGAKFLEQTINSVIGQSYDNVEYIIIDGGSTDGTLDIIRKYEGQIDYWVSEADGGIYDAMNKGTGLVTGEWINFMNSGDWFCSNNIISTISDNESDTDYIYGDHILRYPTFDSNYIALPQSKIWKGMIFSHQSLFVRINLQKSNPFDSRHYAISADYNFISSLIHSKNLKPLYIEIYISSVDMVGFSGSNVKKYILENYKVNKKYNNSFHMHFYYLKKYVSSIPKELIKEILPTKYTDFIRVVLNK